MDPNYFAEIAEECKRLWLDGSTLVEIGHHFGIPHVRLSTAISEHFGIPIEELKEMRLKRKTEKIFKQLLPQAKVTGYIPSSTAIYPLCNASAEISRRVVALFYEAGFQSRRPAVYNVRLKGNESLRRLCRLYTKGLTRVEIAKQSGLSLKQVDSRLTRYNKKFPGELKAAREKMVARKVKEKALTLVQKLNRLPSLAEIKKAGFKKGHFRKYALDELKGMGYEPTTGQRDIRRIYSKEQIHQILVDLASKLGHTPCCREIKDAAGINAPTLAKHFGSIRNAQIQAGLQPNTRGAQLGNPYGSARKYTSEQLLQTLRELSNELSHTPTSKEVRRFTGINPNQYCKRFGSLTRAQELAGLKPNRQKKGTPLNPISILAASTD